MAGIVSLLPTGDPPSQRKATTDVSNAPVQQSAYSAFPCEGQRYSVSPIDGKPCKEKNTAPVNYRANEVEVLNPPKLAKSKPKPLKQAPGAAEDDLAACFKSGLCVPFDPVHPKPVAVYATVTANYATIDKRCAFLPSDNYGRCGYRPQTIAELQRGDRLRVLSPQVRAENGEDIYKVRTKQGWEGWIEVKSIAIERQ